MPPVPARRGMRRILFTTPLLTLYQFCNGTNWIQYESGFAWLGQAHNNPTYPAGVGFFVLSKTTYTGNLGDLSGANASCLTDLTTNTGWKGYSTANSRGLLTGAKVFAFLM